MPQVAGTAIPKEKSNGGCDPGVHKYMYVLSSLCALQRELGLNSSGIPTVNRGGGVHLARNNEGHLKTLPLE
jgi:hypothetical protein